ncbi:MAG: MFS transporter [Saprospiraceae bacterium]|nr:MFS transporter [Saprospiraceae bacterium]
MYYLRHLFVFFTHKSSVAVGTAFLLLGFMFGNWATLIPYVKTTYNLDDAVLGLVLLSMPLGSLISNPVAAILIQKSGMRKVTIGGMIFLSFAYMVPLSLPFFAMVPFGLVLSGFGITTLNVAMNTCASSIEQHEKIHILSTCHGLFSVGLMFGSITGSFTFGMGYNPAIHMVLMGFLGLIATYLVYPVIMKLHDDDHTNEKKEKFKLFFPKGALLLMVVISVCVNFTEGSMADWTALYMKEIVQANPYFIGWGLAGYSLFMAIGRFAGDGIIPVVGRNKILVYGACLSIAGFGLAILFPSTVTTICGFALIGLGVSCGAPILYGSAGRVPDLPKGAGLAVMNTFAMGGFLIGPVIIGFISNWIGLQLAFAFVALLCLVWLFYALRVKLF